MNEPELTAADLLFPDWAAAPHVRALVTTRNGGVSGPPFGRWQARGERGTRGGDGVDLPGGLNLGRLSGDDLARVEANRARLLGFAGVPAAWLSQVHGADVVDAHEVAAAASSGEPAPRADASVANRPGVACVVMVADCMPVLVCDRSGRAVGAAHAGWRGLAAGVVEETARRVAALADCATNELHAYLGPAIGPTAFEVGPDVRDAFMNAPDAAGSAQRDAIDAAFAKHPQTAGKYLADLPALARLRLEAIGVTQVSGGDLCTVTQRERFYSYRRDRVTGRMAAMIWLER